MVTQNNRHAIYCWKNYLLKVEYDLNNINSNEIIDDIELEKERRTYM